MATDLQDQERKPGEIPDYGHDLSAERFHDLVEPGKSTDLKQREQNAGATASAQEGKESKSNESATSSTAGGASDEAAADRSPMGQLKNVIGRLGKKRAKGAIITAIIAAIFGGGLFVAPNFAVIHLKEILMDDFNYVRDAASDAQLKIFGEQLKDQATSNCGRVIKFACRYEGLSARQVDLLKNAGIEVTEKREWGNCTNGGRICRVSPKKMRFQGKDYSPQEMARELRTGQNRELIAAFRTGFQPRWVAFASKSFDKVRLKRNLSKEPINASTQREVDDRANERIKAASSTSDDGQGFTEKDGKYYDSEGKEVSAEQAKALENIREADDKLDKLSPSSLALNGVTNIGMSAVNIAKPAEIPCQAYGYLKMASIGLKVIAAATFAAVAWNAIYQPADTLKLGQGLAVATMLAAGAKLFTPDKAGNTAFEAPHYESLVNKTKRRDNNDKEMRVYGGLALGIAGAMKKALTAIKQYTGDKPDSTCKVVQNPWVQGTGLVAGIALAIFTGGTSALASAGIGAAAQAAMGVAIAVTIPTIMGIVENNLIDATATGGLIMVAAVLGKAVLHSENAQATGLRAQSKLAVTEQTKRTLADARKRAELERLVHKPWDVSSPYTLAGSTVRGIAPKLATLRTGISLTSLPGKLFGSIASGLNAKAFANDAEYAQWRANECQEDYNPNLATGPDCEVEYKPYTNMDIKDNDIWLEDNGFIDSEGNYTEKARGDEGGNYFRDCVERTTPIGLTDDTTKDVGNKCIDGQGGDHEELFDRFAAHGISSTVLDGMDNEPNPSLTSETPQTAERAGGTSAAQVTAFKKRVDEEWGNGKVPDNALCAVPFDKGHMLFCGASEMFAQVNTAYKARFNKNICITDSYRTFAEQVRLKKLKPGLAATPGKSNHGYGTATDLCGGIQNFGTPQHTWLAENGPRYGWFLPSWARAGGSKPEPWHFEFQGIGGKGD